MNENIEIIKPIILATKIKKLGGQIVALAYCKNDRLASVQWMGEKQGWIFNPNITAGEIIFALEVSKKDMQDFKLQDQKFHITEIIDKDKIIKN